jgi:hypothetical protein
MYSFLPSLCFWEMKQCFVEQCILCHMLISTSSCWQKILEFCLQTSELFLVLSCLPGPAGVQGNGKSSGKQPAEEMAN